MLLAVMDLGSMLKLERAQSLKWTQYSLQKKNGREREGRDEKKTIFSVF